MTKLQMNELADRYWKYSLSVYARAEVQTLCLKLQRDYAANVNLLLLAGFAGSAGLARDSEHWGKLSSALMPFSQQYVLPIRSLRERLQVISFTMPAADAWYRQLKALELQAERMEQFIIAACFGCRSGAAIDARQASALHSCGASSAVQSVHDNLLAYYSTWRSRTGTAADLLGALAPALIATGAEQGNLSSQ